MIVNGYETKTTFWDDFSIADRFGINAIKDTYKRAFKAWKHDVEYITELVLVLNWKCWHYYYKQNMEISSLYSDLYNKLNNWCYSNLKGKDLDYYYRTTD